MTPEQDICEKFPGLRIVTKTTRFWKALGFLVMIFSLGKNKDFLTRYITTVGKVIGVPEAWQTWPESHREITLAHEAIHVGQMKKLGLGSVWLGLIPFAILYLLLPFPIGFAWFRYRFERVAYADSIKRTGQRFGAQAYFLALSRAVTELTGPSYGWAWPFPGQVRKWFEDHAK